MCLRSFCFPFSIPPSNRRRRVSIRYGAAKHVGPPEEKFMLLRKSICRRCNFEPFLRSCPGSGFGEGFLFLVAGTVWGSLSHGPGFAGFAHRNLLSITPFPKEWLFCFCFASPCTTQKCIVLSCRQSMYANEGKKTAPPLSCWIERSRQGLTFSLISKWLPFCSPALGGHVRNNHSAVLGIHNRHNSFGTVAWHGRWTYPLPLCSGGHSNAPPGCNSSVGKFACFCVQPATQQKKQKECAMIVTTNCDNISLFDG